MSGKWHPFCLCFNVLTGVISYKTTIYFHPPGAGVFPPSGEIPCKSPPPPVLAGLHEIIIFVRLEAVVAQHEWDFIVHAIGILRAISVEKMTLIKPNDGLFMRKQGKIYIYICSSCHFSEMRWCRYLKSFLVEDKDLFVLHSHLHGCWCPGDTRSQSISSHEIELVILWYFSFSPNCITRTQWVNKYYGKTWQCQELFPECKHQNFERNFNDFFYRVFNNHQSTLG